MAKGLGRSLNMFSNISNSFSYLRYKWAGSKGDFVFKIPNGITLRVPRRLLSTFKEMFFRAPYHEGLPKNILQLDAPLIIDIGANVGYFSFLMLSKYPKATIHAFEPFPPNFRLLKEYQTLHPNLKLHLHQVAVAGESGELQFHYNANDEFSTSAAISDNQEGSSTKVQALTLPDFLKENKIDKIDWLKVDCEGAEYGIFQNLPDEVFQQTRIITLENHDSDKPGETQADLVKILEKHGFTVKTNGYSPLIWAWRI